MPRYFDKGPDASAALVCQAAANGGCKPRDGGVCGDVELGGEATERCAQQTVPADGSFPACSAECRSFEVSATGSSP